MPVLFLALLTATPVQAAERSYSVTDFDRIRIEGPYIVRLTTGRATTARARGSQGALEQVAIDVQGQTLRIRRNRSAPSGTPGAQQGPLEIELTTRVLRAAWLLGPANLELDGAEGLRVEFTVEGSGRLRATNIEADNLSIGLRGSGRLELAGRAETMRASVEGTGDVDASALIADDLTATTSTSGTVALAAGRIARINALGLGEVSVAGRPACTVQGPSAGQVSCGSDQRQARQLGR